MTYKVLDSDVTTGLYEGVDQLQVTVGGRQMERRLPFGVEDRGSPHLEQLYDTGWMAGLDGLAQGLNLVAFATTTTTGGMSLHLRPGTKTKKGMLNIWRSLQLNYLTTQAYCCHI